MTSPSVTDLKRLFLLQYVPGALVTSSIGDLEKAFWADPFSALAGPWTAFESFVAGAAVTADANSYPPAVRQEAGGVSRLRGKVDFSAIIANGTTVFTLPVGFRPAKIASGIARNGAAFTRLLVNPDGTIFISSDTAAGTSLLLDGITFSRVA